jgi:catechol 2,3-dioxygenase-like lactoylglutathione lyase family enzyme
MIAALAHICLTVRSLPAALAFYRDKLGLKEAFDFRDENGRHIGQYLHVGGRGFIELFEGEHAEPDKRQSYKHFCLEVEDIRAAVVRLRGLGVEVTDVKTGSDRSLQAWLADPDGNRIELHQYGPDSKQSPSLR